MEIIFGAHPVRVGRQVGSPQRKVSGWSCSEYYPLSAGPVEVLSFYGQR